MTGSCGSGLRCVSGSCVCDGTSCGGCCSGGQCQSGTTNSACGRGGAACTVCAPSQTCGSSSGAPCINATLLQSTNGGISSGGHRIVVDPLGQNVYFLDQNNSTTNMRIWRVPTSGGAGQVVASGLNWPVSIAVDSQNLYWTSIADSTVVAQSLSTATRRVLASGQYFPMDIVVRDSTTVYWSACDTSSATQCYVWSLPVSGGAPGSLYTLTGGGNPSLALLLPNLYVASAGLRRVVSIAVAPGGSSTTVDNPGRYINHVDARSGRVAWIVPPSATGAFDGLVKGTSVGGTPLVIASGQAPYSVAVDAANAYWITDSGNSQALYKAPVGGGSSTLLLDNLRAYNIAVDANYVYFLGGAGWGNGLFRTPK